MALSRKARQPKSKIEGGAQSTDNATRERDLGVALESELGSLWKFVNGAATSCRRAELLEHQRRALAMSFHTQFPIHGNNAWTALNHLSEELAKAEATNLCMQERIRAREILEAASEWVRDVQFGNLFSTFQSEEREFDPLFTVRVPSRIVDDLQELARIGRRIRMALIEIGASSRKNTPANRPQNRMMNIAVALQMLKANPSLTNAAIAKAIGVDGATVGRWQEIKLFRQTLASGAQPATGRYVKGRDDDGAYVEGSREDEDEDEDEE